MQSNDEIENTELSGEPPSLTRSLNVVKKLRDMGAIRIAVGHIAVDFPEEQPLEIECELEEDEDVLEQNDIEGMHRIDKWARS